MTLALTNAKLKALDRMTEGGEAIIYNYQSDMVVKIFKPTVNLNQKMQKVTDFKNMRLPHCVVSPIEDVTLNGKFAGYVMKKVFDAEVVHQLSKSKFLKISKMNNNDILEILNKICKSVEQLHTNGIVLGDISDYNILFKQDEPYFIDVDSWGVGNLRPDAYTEIFTAPECYRSGVIVDLTSKTDLFSLSVLAFNILARIHPFNGTLKKDPNMSTLGRIKNGISLLGKEDIVVPKMVSSWDWMSPDLKNSFYEIFEKGKRFNICSTLEDQIAHSKYCPIHDLYYYSKYSECPLCSGRAKLIVTPVIVKVAISSGLMVNVLFEAVDLSVLLNKKCYLSKSNEVVHIATKRKLALESGKQIEYSDDGQFALIADKDNVEILNIDGNRIGFLEKAHGSYCCVRSSRLYYVDNAGYLSEIAISNKGNAKTIICEVYNPLFEVSDDGDVFVASIYPKKAIVRIGSYNHEIAVEGKINEYAIRQDPMSKKWLFIYQLSNGKFRTIVFGDKKVEFDDDVYSYDSLPLSGLCFHNNTIFDPSGGKIIGINYIKNVAKEFPCEVVDESSKLEFVNGKFVITTDEKIYSFGQ